MGENGACHGVLCRRSAKHEAGPSPQCNNAERGTHFKYDVVYSRSTDRGDDWSAPVTVGGGPELPIWPTRPEIAYGSNGLFIVFVKSGWNGRSWSNQVWLTKDPVGGAGFSAPVQLTTETHRVFHPAVAVGHGNASVIVAFTKDWTTDLDVAYTASTDGGNIWDPVLRYFRFTTTGDESSADLSAGAEDGRIHAAYNHDDEAGESTGIWYTASASGDPSSWSPTVQVNEMDSASGSAFYPRPTITTNPPGSVTEGAAIAWTDWRSGSDYDVYFDSESLAICADGFESGDTGAWSSTVP